MIRNTFRAGVAFYFGDGVTRVALHVIAWRLLWWIPMLITKSFFLAVVAIGWGPSTAERINNSL